MKSPFIWVILCLSLPLSAVAKDTKTMTIHQSIPNIVSIDIGKVGNSHGDMLAFDAELTSDIGLSGKLSGLVVTVEIPDTEHETFQDRVGQLVFDFGEDGTLVTSGKSVYPHDGDGQIVKNKPQLRAIVGGTGTFIGARGQVSTTRNTDGTYQHHIELVD